jgi:hypothetical protein
MAIGDFHEKEALTSARHREATRVMDEILS